MNTFELHHGDCLAVLRGMADASVDAIVTDPPYGLSFMGKRWDYDVPSVEVWAECLRVLKPGGHLLAFAGTRTQHRMAVRIEDAGFEIRDMIAWVYASGFPKSLDVSKAIDKARIEDVEPVRVICRAVRAAMDAKGLKSRDLTQHFGGCHPRLIDHWAARDTDSQPNLPTWEQWEMLRNLLDIGAEHDAEVWRLNGRKGKPGDTWQNAEVIGEHEGATPGFGEHRFNVRDTKIRAASETAAQWQGWGTALKPALEPITVARKPLAGTVAENVLRHGTGGLNIDGCRVPTDESTVRPTGSVSLGASGGWANPNTRNVMGGSDAGRWPANLIHDGSEEVVACFPANAGGGFGVRGGRASTEGYRMHHDTGQSVGYGDAGSAARFFYCAKASKRDRDEGMEGFALKPSYMVENGSKTAATNGVSYKRTTVQRNNHPTVKPTDLMRYLCRLVTPPGGVVLDPFTGSGSTGKAAILEGFRFVGIEREAEYIEIARARIEAVMPKPEPPVATEPQLALFP